MNEKNKKIHKQIMEQLKNMTPEEFLQTLVDAGIYTKKGNLTEYYQTRDDPKAIAELEKFLDERLLKVNSSSECVIRDGHHLAIGKLKPLEPDFIPSHELIDIPKEKKCGS